MGLWKLGAVGALAMVVGAAQVEPRDERLYGVVTTAGGRVLEGYLRWDRNEATWADVLDGLKEIPWEHQWELERLDPELGARARRERSIEAFGVRISWDRDDDRPVRVQSGVRFGRLESIEVLDDRSARVRLKGGEEVVLESGSSDLGRSLRGLLVEDADEGRVELRWRDLDRVDFVAAPASGPGPSERRLHGTLRTRGGAELTGFVAWDLDEAFDSDVLDGEEVEGGREHEIAFSEIAAIEYESARSARVVLRDGGELVLRGTNDVDRDNRGIEISDPSFGRALVRWEELDFVTFHEQRGAPAAYDDFGPVAPLRGTVVEVGGMERTGWIRWDNDEAAAWEILDGAWDGVEYDVELVHVSSIERRGRFGVVVTLRDGRVLELDGSNDVDRRNQGLVVTDDRGRARLVRWLDFERVTFAW